MSDTEWLRQLTVDDVRKMSYVSLMAALNEKNRPPGGKKALRLMAQNSFITRDSKVLHIGCNTGSSTLEIVHLIKCRVLGIDISPAMISIATANGKQDLYSDLVQFVVGDATCLNHFLGEDEFDLSFSAGSMAFIADQRSAVREIIRVTKTWGFIADIVLYYHAPPDMEILNKINSELQINIKPWNLEFWRNLYEHEGLELYYQYGEQMNVAKPEEVDIYATALVKQSSLPLDTHSVAIERVRTWMLIFNENHSWLSWSLLIYRKRYQADQITLFGS